MSFAEEHLSPQQIEWLAERRGAAEDAPGSAEQIEQARRHLSACEPCRRLVGMHEEIENALRRLKATGELRPGPDCPPQTEWWRLAAGILPQSTATGFLDHATNCDACGEILRRATEDFAAEESEEDRRALSALAITHANRHRALAQELQAGVRVAPEPPQPARRIPSASPPRRFAFVPAWAYAAAALAVVALTWGIWFLVSSRTLQVEDLVARAYTERRILELRIPGASYAPLQRERGSEPPRLSRPALIEAENLIAKKLATEPEQPRWLAARGQVELLEGQYEDARRSFEEALAIRPDSPPLLVGLASAYFQRAQAENRAVDYGQAIELLGQVLQRTPDDPVALFNSALAKEYLTLFNQAIADWEHYLRVDPQGPWADEARAHLVALREKVSKPSARVLTDPQAAAAVLRARADGRPTPYDPWPDSLDEDYATTAIGLWLPKLAAGAGTNPPVGRPESETLRALADVLRIHHHDLWLADLLSTHSSTSWDGYVALAEAAENNAAGDFEKARAAADRAIRGFSRVPNPAGVYRAIWEKAYALQRAQQGEACLAAMDDLPDSSRGQSYPWIQTQLLLEASICQGMVGRMGEARRSVKRALALAASSGYGSLFLRATHIAGAETEVGNATLAWNDYFAGLQRHWAGAYRPFRVYQFYAEMAYAPEAANQWRLARVLAREAVSHIAVTPNRAVEAVAWHRLGVDSLLAGDPGAAEAEFRKSGEIFSSLPDSQTARTFRFSTEAYRASLEVLQGDLAAAQARLAAIRPQMPRVTQYWILQHYYRTLGDVYLRTGNPGQADLALRSALYIAERSLASLNDDRARIAWLRQADRSYRAYVELQLQLDTNPANALEVWEWYRGAPLRTPKRLAPGFGINFRLLESNPPRPVRAMLPAVLPSLTDSTVLTFFLSGDDLVIWTADNRGVRVNRVGVSEHTIAQVARRFASQCSDPGSDLVRLRSDARQLYDWLLAPVAAHFDPARTLVIEADDSLALIPFQALVQPDGAWFGERFALVYSPGLLYWARLRSTSSIPAPARMLAVGAPALSAEWRAGFPPLPDAESEANAASRQFPQSVLLLGQDATPSAVKRELARADVFHFAGHAVTGNRHTGLLLAAEPAAETAVPGAGGLLDAAQLDGLPLARTSLVVLAACSTAGRDGRLSDPSSLVRAFLRAGVPHVVASRWDVDSAATQDFMRAFYAGQSQAVGFARALQVAAAAERSKPGRAHPYYWAAFAAYGRA